ncbi:MAG: histidine kinase dimerization/phospho-acceptor domain-containing protein, partial [Gaiellaceae bacterium]
MKLNFVAIASHELRTPAATVYGVLKTLDNRGRDLTPELRDELVRVGVEQGERLRRLLEELLDLSRLDALAISVEPRPLVLKAALADVVHG